MSTKDDRKGLSQAARLELAGVSRRDFLKYCGALGTALGLASCDKSPDQVLEDASTNTGDGKPAVVWLNAQDCNGCSIAFLNLEEDATKGLPSIAAVLLDTISLRYHEAVMASSGHLAEETKAEAIAEGGYILVVEGAIPDADDRYCMVGGVPIRQTVEEAAAGAAHIIALGSCATGGGIVRNTPTQGVPVTDVISQRPVINLPMCPANHEHLLLTIVHLLTEEQAPELDSRGRPTLFFTPWVHDGCLRRPNFDAGNFLSDWNDTATRDWCLFEKGCRGPITRSDCSIRGVTGSTGNCPACGAPCQGCANHLYYDGNPLYTRLG